MGEDASDYLCYSLSNTGTCPNVDASAAHRQSRIGPQKQPLSRQAQLDPGYFPPTKMPLEPHVLIRRHQICYHPVPTDSADHILARIMQVPAPIRTAKRLYTVAQGRSELARGAPWVRFKKQSLTPQVMAKKMLEIRHAIGYDHAYSIAVGSSFKTRCHSERSGA